MVETFFPFLSNGFQDNFDPIFDNGLEILVFYRIEFIVEVDPKTNIGNPLPCRMCFREGQKVIRSKGNNV